MNQINTESYKGVRDFYPPDMFIQNYIFDVMKKVSESYGYVEYSASILESSDLYKAKSGEEIVNDQTYNFVDRGGREVTLRPEMTPTVARMVARSKRDLALPVRWYSIPNLFRYEQPQKGRLREHWQLNVDLFGVDGINAEVEIISIASDLMLRFGAKPQNFQILLNNRKIVNALFDYYEFSDTEKQKISKLIDKSEKIPRQVFVDSIREIVGDQTEDFVSILNSKDIDEMQSRLPSELQVEKGIEEIRNLISTLSENGIANVIFKPSLMRGFDYYTGIVFEVFDAGKENRRSLFGGGRYDDLLDIFGSEKMTAVGFGMGDVTVRDYLETYNLLPKFRPTTDLYICKLDDKHLNDVNVIAEKLRKDGVNVAIDITHKKLGDQIKSAVKQSIPYVVCIGDDEIKSGKFKLKELETGKETELSSEEIVKFIKNSKK